jgi:hypothetical protein
MVVSGATTYHAGACTELTNLKAGFSAPLTAAVQGTTSYLRSALHSPAPAPARSFR